MRKIVKTLILLWMGTLAATAQTIHVEEVTLSRGYEAEIPVSYDFKESYYGLQMDFTLPEGIFLDSCQLGQGVREAGYQLYHALLKSGKHRILASNMQLQPMAAGQGGAAEALHLLRPRDGHGHLRHRRQLPRGDGR